MWPMPLERMRSASAGDKWLSFTTSKTQALPSWAIFSIVISSRRLATRSSIGAEASW